GQNRQPLDLSKQYAPYRPAGKTPCNQEVCRLVRQLCTQRMFTCIASFHVTAFPHYSSGGPCAGAFSALQTRVSQTIPVSLSGGRHRGSPCVDRHRLGRPGQRGDEPAGGEWFGLVASLASA